MNILLLTTAVFHIVSEIILPLENRAFFATIIVLMFQWLTNYFVSFPQKLNILLQDVMNILLMHLAVFSLLKQYESVTDGHTDRVTDRVAELTACLHYAQHGMLLLAVVLIAYIAFR